MPIEQGIKTQLVFEDGYMCFYTYYYRIHAPEIILQHMRVVFNVNPNRLIINLN